MITYGTTDQQPLHGTSYYRLKQIEHDGTEELSQVHQVQFMRKGQDLVAWPNPATDRLQVQVDTPYSSAEVFNVLGQPVAVARELVGNVIVFDVAALTSGSYYVRTVGTRSGTASFVKE